MTRLKRLFSIALLAAAGLAAGCYLPTDFAADLRLERNGNYAFRYVGDLTDLSMLQRMASGDLTGDDIAERAQYGRKDLARDKGFGGIDNIEYLGKAKFKVKFERRGNIRREKTFDFVRFNSRFLGVKRLADGTVVVFGGRPNPRALEQLEKAGLKANGVLRIWTNALVKDHNAQDIKPAGGLRIYIWTIKSLKQKPPRLKFDLQ
ncbi:MAG: hypothetical protein QF654_04160 [Alphaproteobacteria bacterium]|jgi:hypothetical protein|nr:hypothetical protein [Alphaproteobacteria bacterium]